MVVILAVAFFAAQGLAFAEDIKTDVQAKAEPVLVEEMVIDDVIDPATGKVLEEDVMLADELVTPPAEPVKEAKKA